MRLRNRLAYIALGLSLVLGACSKSNEPAEKVNPTLSITGSTDQVFSYNASEQTLAIETNQSALKVSSNQNWLTAELQGNTLTIKAAANLTKEERRGQITLSSDNLAKVIDVRQYALAYTLSTERIENVSAKGERRTFTLSTLLKGVEASSPNDWILTNVSSENTEEVIVVVSENSTKETRTGKVVLSVSGQPFAEVAIVQNGKNSYILPSFTFGSVAEAIKTFESNRGSTLLRENEFGEGGTQLAYSINDGLFGELTYTLTLKGYALAALYPKNKTLTEAERAEFEEFLVEQGFEKRKSKESITLGAEPTEVDVYINDKAQTKIYYRPETRAPYYSVSYSPYQTMSVPTLSALPTYVKIGATKAEVEAYEAQNGGTLNTTHTKYNQKNGSEFYDDLYYDIANGGRLKWRRNFVYSTLNATKRNLTQVSYLYDVESIAFYKGLDGDYYLTREFKALAESEGWAYRSRLTNGTEVFGKTVNGKLVRLSVRFYKVTEATGWLLALSYY